LRINTPVSSYHFRNLSFPEITADIPSSLFLNGGRSLFRVVLEFLQIHAYQLKTSPIKITEFYTCALQLILFTQAIVPFVKICIKSVTIEWFLIATLKKNADYKSANIKYAL
jgi:hypothetical protein